MKKLLMLILAAILCFSFFACKGESNIEKAPERFINGQGPEVPQSAGADEEQIKKINELYFKAFVFDGENAKCNECGKDTEEGVVICSECAEKRSTCKVCEEELSAGDYVIHEGCIEKLEEVIEMMAE